MADHAYYYHHHQKCGEKGVPSIYTRVSKYLDWIEKNDDMPSNNILKHSFIKYCIIM